LGNAFGNTLRILWELDGNTLGIREKTKKSLSLTKKKTGPFTNAC
jgi:hypothetical protein